MERIVDGWLQGVRHVPSPNVDDRPSGERVELIVIHNISLPPGQYGGGNIQALFTNVLDGDADPFLAAVARARVSSHLLIERDGTITQFASFERRAWHAGISRFRERTRCNDFSVGIELEGTDFDAFADPQYTALNRVLAILLRTYPIAALCGHSDIAPGRKTDPGPFFEWDRLALPHSIATPSPRA